MARKKRIALILIILSTLLLAGSDVVDIANAEPISSSIPTDFERQSVPSTLSPSDSIDDSPAQESVRWNLGWNSFDGNWFYVDSVNPVSLHSGWLYTSGTWYWLDPETHSMATGLRECNGSMYHFLPSGAMATGWVLDGGTWYYAAGSGALARGPVSVGGVSYCFDAETGAMLTGYQADAQGVRRYFGSCGPLNGWGLVDGSWYWFANGIASTGWLRIGGSWYWLDPDAGGAMATGLHACNDAAYWFNACFSQQLNLGFHD